LEEIKTSDIRVSKLLQVSGAHKVAISISANEPLKVLRNSKTRLINNFVAKKRLMGPLVSPLARHMAAYDWL